MRCEKPPDKHPGASFFALYQRINPLHIRLCSLGDERRAGHSPGAGLAVQPLQHALGEADVDAHRGHIHIGRAEKLEQLLDMMEATRPLLHMAGKETETPNANT